MKQLVFPKIPIKRRVLQRFHSFLGLSMIDAVVANIVDVSGAVILSYHSVASHETERWIDPTYHVCIDIFEEQMRFLAKKRNVISMDCLIDSIKENKSLPAGTTIITFDDGYLDSLTCSSAILKKYNLPATLYLPAGYIEREENQWIDELFVCFNDRAKDVLWIPEISTEPIELNDPASAWKTYTRISKCFIGITYDQRSTLLDSIKKQLGPVSIPPKLTMNWNEVRALVRDNGAITIGSHTFNHTDLSSLDDNEIINEIRISTEVIERETGKRPLHFSCPYSRTVDDLPEILKKFGYMSSVSDNFHALINSRSDPFLIGRIPAPVSLSRLAHYTSGAYPWLSQKITVVTDD
jgi:peptidoglycan/xylan/chitin deacetylase (PgdA/CDA1 family)